MFISLLYVQGCNYIYNSFGEINKLTNYIARNFAADNSVSWINRRSSWSRFVDPAQDT